MSADSLEPLGKCPLCASEPETVTPEDSGPLTGCGKAKCPLSIVCLSPKEWNTIASRRRKKPINPEARP